MTSIGLRVLSVFCLLAVAQATPAAASSTVSQMIKICRNLAINKITLANVVHLSPREKLFAQTELLETLVGLADQFKFWKVAGEAGREDMVRLLGESRKLLRNRAAKDFKILDFHQTIEETSDTLAAKFNGVFEKGPDPDPFKGAFLLAAARQYNGRGLTKSRTERIADAIGGFKARMGF
jgi:hypothetical protein